MIILLMFLAVILLHTANRNTAIFINDRVWSLHYRPWMSLNIPLGFFIMYAFKLPLLATFVFILGGIGSSLKSGPSLYWFRQDNISRLQEFKEKLK